MSFFLILLYLQIDRKINSNGIFKMHNTKKSRCIKRDAVVFDGHDKTDYHIL